MGRIKKANLRRKSAFYSFIAHVAMMLILSIIYTYASSNSIIIIDLSFDKTIEEELVSINFEQPSLDEDLLDHASETSEQNINYAEELESVVLDIDEPYTEERENTEFVFEALNQEIEVSSTTAVTETSRVRETLANIGSILGDGSNGDMLGRLADAGAKTGDIQVSISWNNYNDIDLWLQYIGPNRQGEGIGWSNPGGSCGGCLDVDRNAHQNFLTLKPVENIFFTRPNIAYGRYVVRLNFYKIWDENLTTVVNVRIKIGTEIINKTITMSREDQWSNVHSFAINRNTKFD